MDSKENLEQVVQDVTNVSSPAPAVQKNDTVFRDKPKKNKGMIFGMVFLAILAIGGIGFGVWEMMDGKTQLAKKDEEIVELNNRLAEDNQSTSDETTVDNDETSSNNAVDYVYIGEWGLKIKIPEELNIIGYKFSESNYGEHLAIAAAKTDNSENTFKYTDVDNFFAGSIVKSNSEDGFYPYGTLVYTDSKQNKYYYEGPQADMGSTEEETNAWRAGASLVKEMITNSDNYSEI